VTTIRVTHLGNGVPDRGHGIANVSGVEVIGIEVRNCAPASCTHLAEGATK
jgi:hypothetical protein